MYRKIKVNNKQVGLHELKKKKICITKEKKQLCEEEAYRVKENLCQLYI